MFNLLISTPLLVPPAILETLGCPRPEGVVPFKNRDMDSLTESMEKVLANYPQFKKEVESMQVGCGFDKILVVYKRLGRRAKQRESEG